MDAGVVQRPRLDVEARNVLRAWVAEEHVDLLRLVEAPDEVLRARVEAQAALAEGKLGLRGACSASEGHVGRRAGRRAPLLVHGLRCCLPISTWCWFVGAMLGTLRLLVLVFG